MAMDSTLILSRLREVVAFMEELDKKRGTPKYDDSIGDFVLDININKYQCNTDFSNANHFIQDRFSALRIFIDGYTTYMSNPLLKQYEKDDFASRVIKTLKSGDNFLCIRWNTDFLEPVVYFDSKSWYDEEFVEVDGMLHVYWPNLEEYLNMPDQEENMNLFYKYSYYIILIAQKVSDAVNEYLPIQPNDSQDELRDEELRKRMADKLNKKWEDALMFIEATIKPHLKYNDYQYISDCVRSLIQCNNLPDFTHTIKDIGILTQEDLHSFLYMLHHFHLKSHKRKSAADEIDRTIRLGLAIFDVLKNLDVSTIRQKLKQKAGKAKIIRLPESDL